MKNQWIIFLYGRVTVKISGRGIERLLNVLTRNGIDIWNVKRHGADTITLKIKLADVMKIRHLARKSGCRISFLERSGAPFLLKRMVKNSGFLIGAAMFIVIVFLLSNVIWGIEIKGAKPATEYQIRQELDKMGVKIGKFQFSVDNAEGIQRKLSNNVNQLTWVGVELKGTTYHLQVVEKNEPKQPKKLKPRNLVAKKKAVIVRMDIDDGQKKVDVHDYVEPGQLLVSGEIGQEGEETKLVAAKGEVWGETWYKSHVELPIKTTFHSYNGKEKRKYYILIGGLKIPVWGFGKHGFKEYKTEKNVHKLHFLKWELPLSYMDKTIREQEALIRTYTNKEAEKKALELAKKNIKKLVAEDAIIKDEKILHKVIKNGKVILDIHFKMIENIAVGKPITKEIHE